MAVTELQLARMALEQAERNLRRRQEDFREAPGQLGRQAMLHRAHDEVDRRREELARLEAKEGAAAP
jgi:acyl-CoA reductase-like NAD-dependent aldehyde dehydrogenase